MTGEELAWKTIPELGRLIRSGATSPTELAEFFMDRLERIGRPLNAVVTITRDLAMAQAHQTEDELMHGIDRGPLHGIPYGAKDLLATDGIATSWGAAPFAEQVFPHNAAVIERLRTAGAVLVAKLAMVELAGGFGYQHPNAAFTGPGRNAWNANAWAGGSSSGSGAAVAAGCIPFAIGSETWGSIMGPACYNGITGLRPTYGRVSRYGAMALSWTMDKLGPLARTATDCETVLAAIAGPDPRDPTTSAAPPFEPSLMPPDRFRFAVLEDAAASGEVRANFEASLAVLEEIGTLEEAPLPDLPFDEAASIVIRAEAASAFEEFITSGDCAGLTAPEDRWGLYDGLTLPAVDYLRALRIRRLGSRQLDALLAQYDAIVAPTESAVAPHIDKRFPPFFVHDDGASLGAAGNLCGLPSISVPNGFGKDHLPTGLEFMGRAYSEDRIIAPAQAFQARTDWHTRHPGEEG
ncbi:MAG TPA: amidase [Thermomicrobiales bacterium]|nr:amidase [Thermomicrobiales bacterium]